MVMHPELLMGIQMASPVLFLAPFAERPGHSLEGIAGEDA